MDKKEIYITCFSNGDGIKLTVDKGFPLTKKLDIFYNKDSLFVVIRYVFDGTTRFAETSCSSWEDIKVGLI